MLLALARLVPTPKLSAPITYFALDLVEHELERNLSQIQQSELGTTLHGKVDTKGLWGTYEGGLKFVEEGGLQQSNVVNGFSSGSADFDRAYGVFSSSSSACAGDTSDTSGTESTPPSTPDDNRPPLHIFFLGSTLGNFSRKEGADFLRSLPLRPGSGDTLLLGLDHDNDKDLVELAYNDKKGITRKFIMNGLKVAGRILGDEALFNEDHWHYVNTYNVKERMLDIFVLCFHCNRSSPISRSSRGLLQIRRYSKHSDPFHRT